MKVKLNLQNDSVNTLKEKIEKHSNVDLHKFYLVAGNLKESGFDILEEFLIDLKARKFFVVGIDKKYTTRRMLETFCSYTKNVYVYNNNNECELEGNIFVFEYKDKATVILPCATVSDSSLVTDTVYYTELEFDLTNKEDSCAYSEYIEKITSEAKNEKYIKIDKAYVAKLVEDKEIFSTKQFTHELMSISDLLNKKESSVKTASVKSVSEKVPKIDLNNFDEFSFDIDLGVEEKENKEELVDEKDDKIQFEELKDKEIEVSKLEDIKEEKALPDEEETSEFSGVLDVEGMLFEKSNIKLNKSKIKDKKENSDPQGVSSKKIDLSKVSNIIMELPKKVTKGKEQISVRIPNYIKDTIPTFFEVLENTKTVKDIDGEAIKCADIVLEIIDVGTNEKYIDKEAKLVQKAGQTYLSFTSKFLADIYFEEQDIARIIKLSESSYHIEIVPKTIDEYQIWQKLCTKAFKGSARTFGIM